MHSIYGGPVDLVLFLFCFRGLRVRAQTKFFEFKSREESSQSDQSLVTLHTDLYGRCRGVLWGCLNGGPQSLIGRCLYGTQCAVCIKLVALHYEYAVRVDETVLPILVSTVPPRRRTASTSTVMWSCPTGARRWYHPPRLPTNEQKFKTHLRMLHPPLPPD
eukprot:352889-Pyramimonas_sp.AAC.1